MNIQYIYTFFLFFFLDSASLLRLTLSLISCCADRVAAENCKEISTGRRLGQLLGPLPHCSSVNLRLRLKIRSLNYTAIQVFQPKGT